MESQTSVNVLYQQVRTKDSPHLRRCNVQFNTQGVILSVYKTKLYNSSNKLHDVNRPSEKRCGEGRFICVLKNQLQELPFPSN